MCYLVEAAPPGRRALFGSLSILGIAGGLVLAAAIVTLTGSLLSAEEMYAWGWRLPFLGGLVIGGVGWWMRRGLAETPAFLKVVDAGRTARAPIVVVLREHWRRVVDVGGMVILVAVGFYAIFAWMPTYLRQIVRPPVARAGLINMASIVVLILAIPVAGWVADRVGYRRVLLAANLAYAAAAVPLFHLIDSGGIVAVTAAVFGLAVIHAFSNGPIPAALTDLLPTGLPLHRRRARQQSRLRDLRGNRAARCHVADQGDGRPGRSRLVPRCRRPGLSLRDVRGDADRRRQPGRPRDPRRWKALIDSRP